MHKRGNKQTRHGHAHQGNNTIKHHNVALRAGSGSVLPRRLDSEYIYAPSASSNGQGRESFYNVELAYLLWSLPPTMIMGDINCVLKNTGCTGIINFSKALKKIVRCFSLVDMPESAPPRAVYTHYTPHGAARLEGIYVTSNLSGQKVGWKPCLLHLQNP